MRSGCLKECKSCGEGFDGLCLFELELDNGFGIVAIGVDLLLDLIRNSDFF